MALSKNIIFVGTFLGIFVVLFAAIPSNFMVNQAIWSPTYGASGNQYVISFFNAHNITVYSSNQYGNITYPSDVDLPGYDSDHQIRLTWRSNPYFGKSLSIGNKYKRFTWPITIWGYEPLHYHNYVSVDRGDYIVKSILLADYQSSVNGTYYHCDNNDKSITVNIIYTTAWDNKTLSQSWDDNVLTYLISSGFNGTASSTNMFILLGNLLTFQSPNLGIPGWFGIILNAIIAIPLGLITIYLIYKIIAGIVPTLSGGSGD